MTWSCLIQANDDCTKALEFIEAEVKATKQTVKDNWQVFILSKRPLDF